MYTFTLLGSAFCFQNCFWQKPKEKYEPDVQGNSFFIRMRRIALCLPTDLEPLHFTKVMLKIPFNDGFSFRSTRGKGTQGQHPWEGGWPRRAPATPQDSICPSQVPSGVSGGTSQCQQRAHSPSSARLAAAAAAVFELSSCCQGFAMAGAQSSARASWHRGLHRAQLGVRV